MNHLFLTLCLLLCSLTWLPAAEGPATSGDISPSSPQREDPAERFVSRAISDVALRIENIDYYYRRDGLSYNDQPHLFFRITTPNPVAEIRIFPAQSGTPIEALRLLPSSDFEVVDSLVFVGNDHYRARIRFIDLMETSFPSLILSYPAEETGHINREVRLFPYFITSLQPGEEVIELFQGEEKTIDIRGSNVFNIYTDRQWQTAGQLEYQTERAGGALRVHVRGLGTGHQELSIPLQAIRPFVDVEGLPTFQLPPLKLNFHVKPSRMQFINTDKEFIHYDADRRRREEVRLDYHPSFQLNRTYRIEGQQEPGGQLIAEIHTKSFTSDNKVLAELTTYELHRSGSGYLYIKDGRHTLFMTNFNIVNRPEITNIEILREGRDWSSNRSIYPGETVEVKVEGEGLLDVDIRFDGCRQTQDSIRKSDRALFYTLEVPIDIPRRQIMLFMNREVSQHELLVREYERPADFDFVRINYGNGPIPLTDETFSKPVFYPNTIHDINIVFDPGAIDRDGKLFGKQYIQIEVRLLDENNRLIDLQTINNIVVCPGESSPRHAFYQGSDCNQPPIRLNEHLLRKTYSLDAFSQIVITVRHNDSKYTTAIQSRRASIFVERSRSFDVIVSFPAGLLVKQYSEPGIGNLSGISTSVLAELSFYDKNRIGTKKPFKFGAGFIALNAFNFSDNLNVRRDIGLVLITTIEPIRTSAKFSVPIYFGAGYLLMENDMFAIFGPGIRLNF